MCIKCLLLQVLAEREAQFAAAGEEQLTRGEAIHEELLGAAGTAQASEPEDLGKQSVVANIELVRAQTRSVDADTILKLANAAKALYSTNLSTAGVIRTMEQLVYPAPPETRRQDTQAEAPAAATEPEPAAPASEESELPEAIQKGVARLRAAGFEVDVVRLQL
jgi:hypothetical protein